MCFCYTVIFDIGSRLRYQYPHAYFILCINSQQLLSCKCLIPVMFACSFFWRGTWEVPSREMNNWNYIGLSWLSWPPQYVLPLNILGDVCWETAWLTFAWPRFAHWIGTCCWWALHLGWNKNNDPGFSFCGHQWWLYRWTKVSLPKWYFRCGSLFWKPKHNPYQTYQMIYSLDQM